MPLGPIIRIEKMEIGPTRYACHRADPKPWLQPTLGCVPRDDGAKRKRNSERVRTPGPLLHKRVPSGRGASEQPNQTSDEAPLTPRFWLVLCASGVVTGLLGAFLMWVLAGVEHLAFNTPQGGSYTASVAATSAAHRVTTLIAAGVIGGVSWYLIRRLLARERSEIDDALWRGDARLSPRRSILTSLVSEVVVGMGASIGREAAPKLMGGVSGSVLSIAAGLTPSQRRLVVACCGGAGLAAVYNVPIGGAIFTAEVLYGSFALPVALPALACSSIATFSGWIWLPRHATYVDVPAYPFSMSLLVLSLLGGLAIGGACIGFVRLIGWVSHHRASGTHLMWAMPVAFGVLGVVSIRYPQLLGNGIDMAHDAFLGLGTAGLLAALAALKPLVTAMCLEGGASGGLFTPLLATGATLGALLGTGWVHVWPGAPVGAASLVCAAAMIGAAMQAPLSGLVLVLELTHGGFGVAVPMLAATVLASLLVRQVDGYSIYTARLPSGELGVGLTEMG